MAGGATRWPASTPAAGPETRRGSHGLRLLWGYLLLTALVLATAALLPPVAPVIARNVVSVLGVAALAVGVRWCRPAAGNAWWLIVAGAAVAAAAAATISAEAGRLILPGDWASTLLWALSFPFLIAGLAMLGRRLGRARAVDTLDAGIVALAVFLLLFALAIHPFVAGDRVAITAAVMFTFGTLLVFAAAVRLMFTIGIPTISIGLLLLAVGTFVAAIVTVLLLSLAVGGRPASTPTDILWVIYSILLGAAGLHPSLARTRVRTWPAVTLSGRRTALLVLLSVVAPVAWGAEIRHAGEIGDDVLGFAVPVAVSAVLLLLLVTRLALTARMAEERAGQLAHRSDQLAEAVQEQTALQQQLRHQAMHDPLTGLANRLVLTERMEWALTRPTGPAHQALAVLDLDNFKDINDTLGHPVGDELLIEASHRLLEIMPRNGTLVRLGGDEFAALLEGTPPEQARAWAERARNALRQPYRLEDQDLFLTSSVGVFTTTPAGRAPAPAQALQDADLALYAAKAAGKNRVIVFRPELRNARIDFRRLTTGLRQALAERELAVHYQPVVDLRTRQIVAVEALLRWTPKGRPPVPPSKFIPVAEETGMIGPIGTWAMRQACQDARPWYQLHRIAVAVNISARQLDDPGFAGMVVAALRDNGLPGEALIVEITESSLVATSADGEAIGQLERLRAHHVRVAIDDFGTGYSSLAYVARLPADMVKIDSSFVQGPAAPGGGPAPWAFTRALLQLVRTLNLDAVAEGVETLEQAQALRQLHCRLAQGYLFARPMPREIMNQIIAESGRLPDRRSGGSPGT
jgi:diguanylate cyclase (GGDEF)-like protein